MDGRVQRARSMTPEIVAPPGNDALISMPAAASWSARTAPNSAASATDTTPGNTIAMVPSRSSLEAMEAGPEVGPVSRPPQGMCRGSQPRRRLEPVPSGSKPAGT